MGRVVVRKITVIDRLECFCAGYVGAWNAYESGYKDILVGYVCAESSAFPLDEVLPRHLHALALEGTFEHFVERTRCARPACRRSLHMASS